MMISVIKLQICFANLLILPGYLNKLPGFLSTRNITKIVGYPGTEYSKLLTLMMIVFFSCLTNDTWGLIFVSLPV
jgi:hypothetical protein